MKNRSSLTPPHYPFDTDIGDLFHPAQAFAHPRDVVGDPDLTLNEKRAILASWASDACAVDAAPTLRCAPGTTQMVAFEEILDALRTLDREANERAAQGSWLRRQDRRRSIEAFRSRRGPRGERSGDGLSH